MGFTFQPLLFSGFTSSTSGGGSAPTIGGPVVGGTTGSVLFVGPGSTLEQDNANLNFNDTSFQLTVGGNLQAATFNGYTPENIANKGVANGYAPLDGSAKVPYANLPYALMTFKGAWNPTTNTPTLTNGTGNPGDTYRASVNGTSTSPIADTWFAGDFIIYNGTIWQRSPLADGVISVNGFTGAVTLTQGNLTDSTSGTDGISVTGGTNAVWGSGTSIAQLQASGSQNGFLASTDWTTFNNKQPAGNYANTNLSNLALPTSINQDLLFNADLTYNIGSSTDSVGSIWNRQYKIPGTGIDAILIQSNAVYLSDTSGNLSVDVGDRQLQDASGNTYLQWSSGLVLGKTGGAISANSNQINNVIDPTHPQDALTLNYFTTHSTSGTVTSVALADSTGLFNITGSPVTSSGTLTLSSFQSQTANTFLAAPNGSSGAPTFRLIVASDVPTLNQNTTGTASNITATNNNSLLSLPNLNAAPSLASVGAITSGYWEAGIIDPAYGGTGTGTYGTQYGVVYYSLPSEMASTTAGTTGQVLTANTGSAPTWTTPTSGTVTSISVASTNGLAGSSSGGATPTLTLSTTITGVLKGNGTAISAAVAGTDYVIPSGSITGTASNITATSNSTLTTLSILSLPYSQVTGTPTPLIFADSLVNTSGTVTLKNDTATPTASQYYGTNGSSTLGYYNLPASNPGTVTSVSVVSANGFTGTVATATSTPAITLTGTLTGDVTGTLNANTLTATTNSTLTTLSVLSLPGSQVTGNISGNSTNVTGIVTVSHGGTGLATLTANSIIIGNGTSTPTFVTPNTAGYVLTDNGPGLSPTYQPAPGTVSAFFASSQVTTNSSNLTSGTFLNFSNSPAFTFTPSITGTYKVYCPIAIDTAPSVIGAARVVNTSGGAILLYESQATSYNGGEISDTAFVQSVYTLTAGTSYVFDIQAKVVSGSGAIITAGANAPFYMFAELEVANTASTPTNNYWNGYYPGSTTFYWNRTNTSFGDFTPVGTETTLTQLQSNSFPTVSNSGSNLPGVTFTANRTGTMLVRFIADAYIFTAGASNDFRVIETGTSTILGYDSMVVTSAPGLWPVTIEGYFPTISGTSYTFNLQAQSSSGGIQIGAGYNTFTMLNINMMYIS